MGDFEAEYKRKLTTPDEAVKVVKSGDWIDFGYNVGIPDALDKALAKRMPELEDIKIRGGNLMRELEIFKTPNAAEHFCYNSIHVSGVERKHIQDGTVFYLPIRYSELPGYYEYMDDIDVVMVQVCPMDKDGYFNFGPSTSHLMAACKKAKCVIVEVNEKMPRALGGFNESLPISMVDRIVEGDNPDLPTLSSSEPAETDVKIAEQIFPMIPDGACLQLGIGKTPNAVGKMIAESDLKDLGVHTEMYVDAFMDLTKAGKITCAEKKRDVGRQVYAFAAGSKQLYEFIDNNPALMAASVDYTNDIGVISSIDNFISINSGIYVDLYGQVDAETVGYRHISGSGGQQDFVLGAYLSKGGKSFLCVPAVRVGKDGTKTSNIRMPMPEGSCMTCTRTNTNYLVTEFGMVNLKGMTTWERAEKIISVADPDFRDELIADAEKIHIWRRSNKR